MEQKAVYESNERGKRQLTWAQTKNNMDLTTRVMFYIHRKR